MNVAIINCLAKTKSTGKIAYGLHTYLKASGHNSRIFYGRDDPSAEGEGDLVRFCGKTEVWFNALVVRLIGGEGLHAKHATRRLLKELDAFAPDAVYLLNLHAYFLNFPMLFAYLGRRGCKTIFLMLDEYAFLGKCCFAYSCRQYQTECSRCPQVREYPKSQFFDRANHIFHAKRQAYSKVKDLTFVGVAYTVAQAKESALLRGARFFELDEAVNLREVYYPRDAAHLREQLGIPAENKVIVTVAPFSDERKGGRFFLEAARQLQARKEITFVHVGFDGDRSLCPSNYIPVSYVSNQNLLAEYYSLGDIFVCTSLAETVANTCLEALSCGTPLLAFAVSGMPYCADSEHGTFVEAGNVDALAEAIDSAQKKTAEMIASCRKYAESRYDSAEYFKGLEKLLWEATTR